jgi:SAM-dependent methyltransferase
MDAQAFYDHLGQDYDLMVWWQERIAREEAFFNRVFEERGVRRVLDAACGTGMHSIAFARGGRECTGADISPVMVQCARRNAREAGVRVRFEVAGFGELSQRVGGVFDAITCIGNSLPHLANEGSLDLCLFDFAEVLRPGGILVIQNRNYDRLLRNRQRFMPLAARTDGEGETVFLRMTDFVSEAGEDSVVFTLVTLKKRNGVWSQTVRSTPLRALRRANLEAALFKARFSSVQVYGSYDFAAFDAPGTNDLVAVAVK